MAYFRCGQWITGALPQLCDGERAYESTEALRCIHYMKHYSLGVGPIGYYRALDLSSVCSGESTNNFESSGHYTKSVRNCLVQHSRNHQKGKVTINNN